MKEYQDCVSHDFVRDKILFGYNVSNEIPASRVLADGYGQCNTKETLFMARLRAVGIPCRIHGFTADKRLQMGTMMGITDRSAPKNVLHSWESPGAHWADERNRKQAEKRKECL